MGEVTLVKNRYRLEQWTKLIQECQSSGMKIDDWCDANGVTRHAYYYWLRKVRQTVCQNLPVVNDSQKITTFKRLGVQTPAAGVQAAVIIHFPTVTLEVQSGACQQTVEAMLLALKSLC